MPKLVFTTNDLREFEPELAARLEKEVRDGAADEPADSALECRIVERHAERPQIAGPHRGQGLGGVVRGDDAGRRGRAEDGDQARACATAGRRAPYQRGSRR
jgi:hypothetical protein